MVRCEVCPRHCTGNQGERGYCGARVVDNGQMVSQFYGELSSLALDPIEKKPLARFYPGSMILSVGSYGCNMRCTFCQNHEISQPGFRWKQAAEMISPGQLVEYAKNLVSQGNIGIAFTYNEPGIGFEYLRDCSALSHEHQLKNVMVTNGYLCEPVFSQLTQCIDAFNIDLKCFSEAGYQTLGGDLSTVLHNIRLAAESAHLEVTTLVVPGLSDSESEMHKQVKWLASLSQEIPFHLTRYFPSWKATTPATDIQTMDRLAEIARQSLRYVYLGNC